MPQDESHDLSFTFYQLRPLPNTKKGNDTKELVPCSKLLKERLRILGYELSSENPLGASGNFLDYDTLELGRYCYFQKNETTLTFDVDKTPHNIIKKGKGCKNIFDEFGKPEVTSKLLVANTGFYVIGITIKLKFLNTKIAQKVYQNYFIRDTIWN